MNLVKFTAASAIISLSMCQALFSQTIKNENKIIKNACPGKIEKAPDGREGMPQLWTALRGCLAGNGFIDIENVRKNWGISYRNDVSLIGGEHISDYEGDHLSLRIENRKSSTSEGQEWARYQFGISGLEKSRSELSISMRNYVGSLSVADIEKDLEKLGFKKVTPVLVSPEMNIFSKSDGLTKVTVYIARPIEAAPEVVSLKLDGFK
jgi:hypothetical protein